MLKSAKTVKGKAGLNAEVSHNSERQSRLYLELTFHHRIPL